MRPLTARTGGGVGTLKIEPVAEMERALKGQLARFRGAVDALRTKVHERGRLGGVERWKKDFPALRATSGYRPAPSPRDYGGGKGGKGAGQKGAGQKAKGRRRGSLRDAVAASRAEEQPPQQQEQQQAAAPSAEEPRVVASPPREAATPEEDTPPRPVSRDGRSVALGLAANPVAGVFGPASSITARPTSAKRAERRGKPTKGEKRGYAKFRTPAQRKAAKAARAAKKAAAAAGAAAAAAQ
jgi:hypothetical protein